ATTVLAADDTHPFTPEVVTRMLVGAALAGQMNGVAANESLAAPAVVSWILSLSLLLQPEAGYYHSSIPTFPRVKTAYHDGRVPSTSNGSQKTTRSVEVNRAGLERDPPFDFFLAPDPIRRPCRSPPPPAAGCGPPALRAPGPRPPGRRIACPRSRAAPRACPRR